jgi:hypothetical protein
MMNIDEVLDELQQCSSILLSFDLTVKREKTLILFGDVACCEWNCCCAMMSWLVFIGQFVIFDPMSF